MHTTQFDISDNDVEQIKQRVNSWVASFSGADYYIEKVSERHAKVKKTKHDWKVCCYGCCAYFGIIFGGLFLFMRLFISTTPSYEAVFSGLLTLMLGAVMIIPLFIGWFCLYPSKVEFDIQFIGQGPVQVRITASGNMLAKAESDYQDFLRSVSPRHGGSGIDPL